MNTELYFTDEQIERALLSPHQRERGWRVDEILHKRVMRRSGGPAALVVVVVFTVAGPEGRPGHRFALLVERNGRLRAAFITSHHNELVAIANGADRAVDVIEEASDSRRTSGRVTREKGGRCDG